jgi:hypothetical protein
MFEKLLRKKTPTKKKGQPPPIPKNVALDGLVFNCITSEFKSLGAGAFVFGSVRSADFVISGQRDRNAIKVVLSLELGQRRVVIESGDSDVFLNGTRVEGADFIPKSAQECTLQIGESNFFLIRCSPVSDLKAWKDRLINPGWTIHHWMSATDYNEWVKLGQDSPAAPRPVTLGPMPIRAALEELQSVLVASSNVLVNLEGSEVAFYGHQFKAFSKPKLLINPEGSLRCPRCWRRFDASDMLAIHPIRRGDEVLGEAELHRFIPKTIGPDGRAITEDNQQCSDWACPHCRGKLPQGFHQIPLHILSLVGDSMAGKSYFLAITVRQLKRVFFSRLGINFSDGDAPGNAVINDMIRTLNTARSPDEAALEKTQLAGVTYKRGYRFGEEASHPIPFVYTLANKQSHAISMVLYDNAGEHFRPEVDERNKANATEHLACSSGMMFLFDPVQHVDLLKLMETSPDPQISIVRSERLRCDQDVILNEIGGRIRQWKGLAAGERSDVPLALIVAKYDLWEAFLPRAELQIEFCKDGQLDMPAIEHNSKRVRHFMLDHCPDIVNAAEMISTNICYFPVSSFGSHAVRTDGGKVAPEPSKIDPFLVEVPLIWNISKIEPKLFS